MIHETIKKTEALLVCPECKNTVDLSRYPIVSTGMAVECNHCGMTLLVKNTEGENIVTEIMSEGK